MESRRKVGIISVLDKTHLVGDIGRLFNTREWDFFASQGTAKLLNEHSIVTTDVAKIVGGNPILKHRVATISREVAAGLLARILKEDLDEMGQLNLPVIDFAYVGLYDVEKALQQMDPTLDYVLDNTDVGGILLIHAAVKGCRCIATNRDDYLELLPYLQADEIPDDIKRKFMVRAEFFATYYLAMVTRYLNGGRYDPDLRCKLAEAILGNVHDCE